MHSRQQWLPPAPSDNHPSTETASSLLEPFLEELLHRAMNELDHRLRRKLDPGDLVQETFIRAYAGFVHFQGTTHEELAAWIHTVMDFTLAELRRQFSTGKRDTRREVHEVAGEATTTVLHNVPTRDKTPSSLCRSREEEERLRKILELLPDRFRRVLQARYWDDRTFEEISQELSMTRPGIRKLYERALAEVRRLMHPGVGV